MRPNRRWEAFSLQKTAEAHTLEHLSHKSQANILDNYVETSPSEPGKRDVGSRVILSWLGGLWLGVSF